jgi:hypothetical protein
MTDDEYNLLFHKTQANTSAFKRLMDCDAEVIKMIEVAVEAEREACAQLCDARAEADTWEGGYAHQCANEIRARSAI